MNVMEKIIETKESIKKQQAVLAQLEVELYTMFQSELNAIDKGTWNRDHGQYNIKIVKKMTETVDQKIAKQLADNNPSAFKVKYSLDKKAIDKMPPEVRSLIDDCITVKPAKPSFSVERIDEN